MLFQIVLGKASQVIVPTQKVENILKRYGVGGPVAVMPTGIELSRFKEKISREEKNRMKKALGIPVENKVLVSVGKTGKGKESGGIAGIFFKARKRRLWKKLTFLIAGDGPDREELETLARELQIDDQVIFTG